MNTDLQNLGRRLVGRWTIEATHPAVPGTVISGSSEVEWFEGQQFLIYRLHYYYLLDFPMQFRIIGDTDGPDALLRRAWVHRLFQVTVADDGWAITMGRQSQGRSFRSRDPSLSQRMTYTFEHADQNISGRGSCPTTM